jgi:hypothetical protein
MHRSRFPHPFRRAALRVAHPVRAITLLSTLLVGLACDETAPTETRAPAGPAELDPGPDEPDLAVGDITAMGTIELPINQTVATTPPNPAFRIGQTGTGPNGIFQISNSSNNRPAVQGLTNGVGRGGYFQLTNASNAQPGIEVITAGTGRAGMFTVSNASSTSPVIHAVHNGWGPAGLFASTNAERGADPTVYAQQSGSGPAGRFDITNAHSSNAAVIAVNSGRGRAAHFENTNSAAAATLFVKAAHNPEVPRKAAEFIGNVTVDGDAQVFNNLHVDGTLSKTAGSFKIDHPLDPEHKYLSHSFIESPDMMNVYNGNVTLDANGRATVELPDYFEALNRDFRYQLTAVGAPGPNLYIAEGVQQNRFKIAGGRPYASVSWQVTGIRQDTFANEHRIKVEEDKPR